MNAPCPAWSRPGTRRRSPSAVGAAAHRAKRIPYLLRHCHRNVLVKRADHRRLPVGPPLKCCTSPGPSSYTSPSASPRNAAPPAASYTGPNAASLLGCPGQIRGCPAAGHDPGHSGVDVDLLVSFTDLDALATAQVNVVFPRTRTRGIQQLHQLPRRREDRSSALTPVAASALASGARHVSGSAAYSARATSALLFPEKRSATRRFSLLRSAPTASSELSAAPRAAPDARASSTSDTGSTVPLPQHASRHQGASPEDEPEHRRIHRLAAVAFRDGLMPPAGLRYAQSAIPVHVTTGPHLAPAGMAPAPVQGV